MSFFGVSSELLDPPLTHVHTLLYPQSVASVCWKGQAPESRDLELRTDGATPLQQGCHVLVVARNTVDGYDLHVYMHAHAYTCHHTNCSQDRPIQGKAWPDHAFRHLPIQGKAWPDHAFCHLPIQGKAWPDHAFRHLPIQGKACILWLTSHSCGNIFQDYACAASFVVGIPIHQAMLVSPWHE
jgi:hypothetical protein